MSLSATPSASPATLACAALPTRVRDILQALKALLWQSLEAPLQSTLAELERALFDQAERARNSQLQQDVYQELQGLRARRERFAPFYKAQLEAALATLRLPPGPLRQDKASAAMQVLTLVADVDIDRDIVLHDIARREAKRASTPLQLLGQRFGVLAARPAFEAEHTPLGPHLLCRILREAGEELQLGLDAQLTLYRAFERQALVRYGGIVERANVLLAHAGVLPGLVYLPYVARPTTTPDAAARGRGAARPAPAARPATGWSGQAAPSGWSGPDPGATDGAAAAPNAAPAAQARTADTATSAAPAQANAADNAAPDLAALRQLLAAARGRTAAAAATAGTAGAMPTGAASTAAAATTLPAPGHPAMQATPHTAAASGVAVASTHVAAAVPTASLLQALGELQAQPPAHSALAGLRGRRQVRDVQAALLATLRAEHGPQAALAPQDADTFDLLGLLYAEIEREVRSDAPAAGLLERLQVPLVRAALQDSGFFVRSQHPARELLNAIAESGAAWLSEEDTDPQLLLKLNQTVDRVVEEYEGDEQVFEQAHQDIQAQYRTLAHKAEIAERRHIEAARGKERLEVAKDLASATLEALCQTSQPPKFVQALLRQAWSDVLTLTLLRQGEDSDAWRERKQLSQCIAEITCRSGGGGSDPDLAGEVRSALLQVGYHQDEAEAIARRLSTPGGDDALTSRTELSARLKARTRLGDQREDAERPLPAPRNEAEQAAYTRLRGLPFGTWFEFVTNQQGDLKRQRLSWYSPITERALFVNQRGHKAAEYSLDALSRLLAQGQARIVSEDRARLIDRAWHATVRALRTLAGAPAPAATLENA
ncbi:DUF1631 domain-containing protein [Xanthomonas translucens pv. graminis]|uniref:DUF1631 domain-containing protein n=1 Tax=Xanthomonas graminis TaxID=3390026 RepID=UPI00253FADBF|nr:DUF1631 domain-containing protein [Xanthomonas translucens]WIH04189.1 DUF1631 domain-containing protein [Xanthomonas translucens pv. graminis]